MNVKTSIAVVPVLGLGFLTMGGVVCAFTTLKMFSSHLEKFVVYGHEFPDSLPQLLSFVGYVALLCLVRKLNPPRFFVWSVLSLLLLIGAMIQGYLLITLVLSLVGSLAIVTLSSQWLIAYCQKISQKPQ